MAKVSKLADQKRPIGVFDSGLGGLTVVRELLAEMPHEDIVYFGDLARLPYGSKSREQIIEFSLNNVQFLVKQRVKAVIVACNSSASAAAATLKKTFAVPIVDVISAAVSDAVAKTRSRRIGVLGTSATIASGVYQRHLKRALPDAHIVTQSCSLFVPLVEEGWLEEDVTYEVARKYMRTLKEQEVDVVILGCTHYPLLKKVLSDVLGEEVRLIESAPGTVAQVRDVLAKDTIARTQGGNGRLSIFVSDKSRNFEEIGGRFLGKPMDRIKVVKW